MGSKTNRRDILRYVVIILGATVAGAHLSGYPLFGQEAQDRQGGNVGDYPEDTQAIDDETEGVIKEIQAGGENDSSDIDELKEEMEVPEALRDSESDALVCTEAAVAHSYMKKGSEVDFYQGDESDFYYYRVDNTGGSPGRVKVEVFFYDREGEVVDSVDDWVFVDSSGSASGRISASQSYRQYPVYLAAVTHHDCS